MIGYVWPEPDSSAAGGRMLGLLRLFKSQGWEVIFASPAADSEFMADLAAIGVIQQRITLNHTSFDAFVSSLQPQMVLFDRFLMEEQFGWRVAEQCPGALRILDTVDLHFLRQARHAALKEKRSVTRADLQSDMAKREIASILRCDLSLLISGFEMDLLRREFKIDAALLRYFPLTVSPIDEAAALAWRPFETRRDFVFVGNFLHEPNWDAILHLKQAIWPRMRGLAPKAQLHVYGAYPMPKALQLHQPKEGFHVHGRAENARHVVANARICLAPLRFGAGVKGKLLEAMQCGTPSVTTAIGAEGMHGGLPWSGIIAESSEDFAVRAVELHDDSEQWHKAQQRGMAIVNTCNAAPLFEGEFVGHLVTLLESLEEHRSGHFLGSLLHFHTLRSTEFMARWIEEKNKRIAKG